MAWARSLLSVVELSGGHFPKKCLEVIDNERLEGGWGKDPNTKWDLVLAATGAP